MENINLKPIQTLRPFTKFCCTIGNLPSSYLVSLTYEEQLLWLCNYLQNTVIPTINNNAGAVCELQELYEQLKSYVDNYFTNLDVQNEINNKLDEMATDGTLNSIINEQIFSEINNSIEELKNQVVNVKNYGATGNGNTDDTLAIQSAINVLQNGDTLYIPAGNYKITPQNQYTLIGYGADIQPYYGLYINNKSNINIKCEGMLLPDISINVMNIIAIQNCNNINIDGLKAIYKGTIPVSTDTLQKRTLLHVNNSTNINANNLYSENVGGNTIFANVKGGSVRNSKGTRTSINYLSGTLFGAYASSNIIIENCIGYGGTNDGDISIYGNCSYCIVNNCKIYNTFENSSTINNNTAQGICIDSGCFHCKATNNITLGYYFGIDIKTNCSHIIVNANNCIQNKIGIAVRLGEGNSPTLNTLVSNNTIAPNGGNGNTTSIIDDYDSCGIYLQNTLGVTINDNIIANSYNYNSSHDFIGIYGLFNNSLSLNYLAPTNITNNLISMESRIGTYVSTSNAPCIYLLGTQPHTYKHVNINSNNFKTLYNKNLTIPCILLNYVESCNITNNMFFDKLQSSNCLSIENSYKININSNQFRPSRQAINITDTSYVNIVGNMLQNSGEYFPTINLSNVTKSTLVSNYYIGTNNEHPICYVNSCNYISAIANSGMTNRTAFIEQNSASPSTNITNSDTNILYPRT